MNLQRWKQVQEVLCKALDCNLDERNTLLDFHCGSDMTLRSEVESLLRAAGNSNDFLERAPFLPADAGMGVSDFNAKPGAPPTRLGRYTVLRRLGEGGMGVVYLAHQDEPKREAALKLVQRERLDDSSRRRLAREAEALGRLSHPGIARIYEAYGGDGQGNDAYIAMEYVNGPSITHYAREAQLGVRQKLKLLASVCDIVQYAHQKGVLHRDLKPANILVSVERTESRSGYVDARDAQPKVLDFGIARLLDTSPSRHSQTITRDFAGTLPYMSPEDVSGDHRAADTRSDVYSLGVVGYELLTGKLPLDFSNRSLLESARLIADVNPTPLHQHDPRLGGDVASIFVKALAKEPEERYASAAAFADDIRRSLNEEPITARPASAAYVFRKFARRHRAMVATVTAATVLVLAGAVIATWQAISAAAARDLAQDRLVESRTAEKEARFEYHKSAGLVEFYRDLLMTVDPESGAPVNPTMRQAIDYAASRVEDNLTLDASAMAVVHGHLGDMFRRLDSLEQAREHLQRAAAYWRESEVADPELVHVLRRLAALEQREGQYGSAETLYEEAIDTVGRVKYLGDATIAMILHDLGVLHIRMGMHEEAESNLRESLRLLTVVEGHEHRRLSTMNVLAAALHKQGRYEEAEPIARETLERRQELLGEDDPAMAPSYDRLAMTLIALKRFDEALPIVERLVAMDRERFTGHPNLAYSLAKFSNVMFNLERHEEGMALSEEALKIWRASRRPDHPQLGLAYARTAIRYLNAGETEASHALIGPAIEILRANFPDGNADLANALTAAGRIQVELEELQDAETSLREAIQIYETLALTTQPDYAIAMKALGAILEGSENEDP